MTGAGIAASAAWLRAAVMAANPFDVPTLPHRPSPSPFPVALRRRQPIYRCRWRRAVRRVGSERSAARRTAPTDCLKTRTSALTMRPIHSSLGGPPPCPPLAGRVPKWPTGSDCKSDGLCLRRFESCRAHVTRNPANRGVSGFSGLLTPASVTPARSGPRKVVRLVH